MAEPNVTPHPARIEPTRVRIRPPMPEDEDRFIEEMQRSHTLHHPWIFPPTTRAAYRQYLARARREDHEAFLVCTRSGGELVGAININNIVRGGFLSASLGYYAGITLAGRGLMAEGLELVKRFAVNALGLHRLEANIQPANARSIALVRRSGFRLEGMSPAYLYIDGGWRDHERWTWLDPRASLDPQALLK